MIALNDAIADGRDVSWIWDVDFEPLLGGLDRLVATGDRAAELALAVQVRRSRPRPRSTSCPRSRPALDRGLELTPPGGELVVLPTYTAMLALRQIVERARLRAPVLGAGGVKIVVGHLYPDYLNIYADRGNIAVLSRRAAWRGHELEVRAVSVGDPLGPGEHDLLYVGGGQDREQALVAQDLAREGGRRASRLWTAEPRCSRSAAATSCSGARTETSTGPSCRASACSRSTRSPGNDA